MRDKRFIAEHRGGLLSKEHHLLLMKWACKCSKHVFSLLDDSIKKQLQIALDIGNKWITGKASVGDARKASVEAIHLANELIDPISISAARSVGHAVATAHMADHSLGAAWYALKAVHNAGKPTETERNWQDKQLPLDIKELVLSARKD